MTFGDHHNYQFLHIILKGFCRTIDKELLIMWYIVIITYLQVFFMFIWHCYGSETFVSSGLNAMTSQVTVEHSFQVSVTLAKTNESQQ